MPQSARLTCRELVEIVTDYLEGTLDPADRERFEAHIAICDPCTGYLAQMRRTLRTLGRVPEESLSPAARETMLHLFRGWRSG
jgi:anti-sigma factor RsiW